MTSGTPTISANVPSPATTRWQGIGPVLLLLLSAPLISEVLYGATRISTIFVLVPEIMTWGCGALLIRECVRRWRKGWRSMLLLGLALAIAEEWIIQQTSIAPLVGLAAHPYGRVWGVNWIYFLWALGYESVWVVLIPVQLVELLFPERREETWLRTPGFIIASFVFLIGAFMAWYGWTQQARVQIFHMPPYTPPLFYLLDAACVIGLLAFAAYALPDGPPQTVQPVPSPWTIGLTLTLLGSPWAALVLSGFGSFPKIPFQFVLAGGLLWSAATFLFMNRWTCSRNWNDLHRFALVLGGVLACTIGGFAVFRVGGALRMDWIGKVILDAVAIGSLVAVGFKLERRTARDTTQSC